MADNETFRFLGGLIRTILFSVCVRMGACLGVLLGARTARLEAILTDTEGTQNWSHFWVQFSSTFGSQNGPQNGPKTGPKLDFFGVYFWIPFFGGFGALSGPLGSLLGPLEALLGGLWTPKTLKNMLLFKVFEDAAFWLFGALDGPLGHLGPSCWEHLWT